MYVAPGSRCQDLTDLLTCSNRKIRNLGSQTSFLKRNIGHFAVCTPQLQDSGSSQYTKSEPAKQADFAEHPKAIRDLIKLSLYGFFDFDWSCQGDCVNCWCRIRFLDTWEIQKCSYWGSLGRGRIRFWENVFGVTLICCTGASVVGCKKEKWGKKNITGAVCARNSHTHVRKPAEHTWVCVRVLKQAEVVMWEHVP